jgi:putative Ca2+/H+ antiporter (TMEM165/GDT1 family)
MNLSIIAIVFAVIFFAELPDKSMFAALALGQRYRRSYVWMGAAAAFLVQVLIAVTAGRLLRLLPHHIVEAIVALLFFAGAMLLFFGKHSVEEESDKEAARLARMTHSFRKVFTTSFIVVFIGELGDITQIATANYAAKYHDTLSVVIGATLGLWTVAALGIVFGSKLLDRVPSRFVQRGTAVVLLLFAIISATAALK